MVFSVVERRQLAATVADRDGPSKHVEPGTCRARLGCSAYSAASAQSVGVGLLWAKRTWSVVELTVCSEENGQAWRGAVAAGDYAWVMAANRHRAACYWTSRAMAKRGGIALDSVWHISRVCKAHSYRPSPLRALLDFSVTLDYNAGLYLYFPSMR